MSQCGSFSVALGILIILSGLSGAASAQANLSPAPAPAPPPSNNDFQLSDDSQQFNFRSDSYRLTIPGGTSFAFPPGYQLPPDLAAKLQQSGGALPVHTSDGSAAVLTGPVASAPTISPSVPPVSSSPTRPFTPWPGYIPNFEPPPTTKRPGAPQKFNPPKEQYKSAGVGGYMAYGSRSYGNPDGGRATDTVPYASNDY